MSTSPFFVSAFRRRFKRWHLVFLTIVSAILLPVAALFFSSDLLLVESKPTAADAIVVLGGDDLTRSQRGAELFPLTGAPVIIVSGFGDSDAMKLLLVKAGVPESAIREESKSRHTTENAMLSIALLRKFHAKRVVIVTSWFHSRRALHCFRHYAPDMEFISRPTVADRPKSHWPGKYERGYVIVEYLKLLFYWIRYGISPF
jgi:uncharacterized SAM-binding protein YcdF (DUF218 family)